MNRRKGNLITIFSGICMLVLILDAKLVLRGAVRGIELCLWTVIPSLFPFLVISALLRSNISKSSSKALRFIGAVYKIPSGCESVLLVGYLGGYPVGAQGIMQAYNSGTLSKKEGQRMLAFCNNAGPAFIFGMASQLFDQASVGWFLWLTTIFSSLIVAVSIPGKGVHSYSERKIPHTSFPQIISDAVKAMTNICAWVILFRVILSFLQVRVFNDRYPLPQTVLFGFLELSNGMIEAGSVSDPQLRFILCAVFLNAGGLCVAMQTHSLVKEFGLRTYLLGKTLQTIYSFLLSLMLLPIVFPESRAEISVLSAFIVVLSLLFTRIYKKSIAFSGKI